MCNAYCDEIRITHYAVRNTQYASILDIKSDILEHIEVAQKVLALENDILKAGQLCKDAILRGHKILIAGNGGSAADAQHIAAEFIGRYEKDRPSMPALALTVDTSALTAISNDYGFEAVFSRQIEGLGQKGDVFIGISTSGNSKNIIKAVETAHQKGLKIILFLGKDGGILRGKGDVDLIVPSQRTARIQEMHILIGHIICSFAEN
jgi:D-sedoheptulose 7-phosphate isomerase